MTALRSEKVTFTGALGEQLAARLDLPEGAPAAYALFAHCFTCSKESFAAARVARSLTAHGIAVLRFDFTGLGSSDGEFENTTFSSNVDDLVAAADFLRDHDQAPKLLIGHSLGGAAVLAGAGRVPEALAVATIGAPADPAHVTHHFTCELEEIERTGKAEVDLGGRPFTISKAFLDDIAETRMKDAVHGLRKALLLFHAPLDNVVGVDNASKIFVAAKHPKSFVSLDDADHLLTRREDAAYVADVISAWASRYIGVPGCSGAERAPELKAEAGAVVVAESGAGNYANLVSVGGKFALRADEPVKHGGQDTGPSPYDYLLAGLGACTSMTLRMYADLKKLPLHRVAVTLHHKKIHAEDCADCESQSGKIDVIERDIEIEGDLTPEQRQRLLEIADKCPVHRTLHNEVKVVSRLKGD
ncbi:bifunctional alpha/beta hydrolase/OsmC family protein [Magnetospira thiophila]